MVTEHYPPEFRAEAVALHRSRPGATIKSVADDFGGDHETLRNWIRLVDAQGLQVTRCRQDGPGLAGGAEHRAAQSGWSAGGARHPVQGGEVLRWTGARRNLT